MVLVSSALGRTALQSGQMVLLVTRGSSAQGQALLPPCRWKQAGVPRQQSPWVYSALPSASVTNTGSSSSIGCAPGAATVEPGAVLALQPVVLIREVVMVPIFRWQG